MTGRDISQASLTLAQNRWRLERSTPALSQFVKCASEMGTALAVLSDAHGNLRGLASALADLDSLGSVPLLVLGDTIGRGTQPIDCVDLVRQRAKYSTHGRWEAAVLGLLGAPDFGSPAADAVKWLREQLSPRFLSPASGRRWAWLQSLPRTMFIGGFNVLACHSGINEDPSSTVFFEDVRAQPSTRDAVLAGAKRFEGCKTILVGGSLEAWVCNASGDALKGRDVGDFYEPKQGESLIVSSGSVGSPRGGDPRATYCLILSGSVVWRRCVYDVEAYAKEVERVPGVTARWGDRIRRGI